MFHKAIFKLSGCAEIKQRNLRGPVNTVVSDMCDWPSSAQKETDLVCAAIVEEVGKIRISLHEPKLKHFTKGQP